jgi:hypothetical protein
MSKRRIFNGKPYSDATMYHDCEKEDCSQFLDIYAENEDKMLPTDIWIHRACHKPWTTQLPQKIGEQSTAGFLRTLCCGENCSHVIKYVDLSEEGAWDNFQMEVNIQNYVAITSREELTSGVILLARNQKLAAVGMDAFQVTVRAYMASLLKEALEKDPNPDSPSIMKAIDEIRELVNICWGKLAELHKIGIAHLDPHLHNFMFKGGPSQKVIKLIDFGLSTKIELHRDEMVNPVLDELRLRQLRAMDFGRLVTDIDHILDHDGFGAPGSTYSVIGLILNSNKGLEDKLKKLLKRPDLEKEIEELNELTTEEVQNVVQYIAPVWKIITAVRYVRDNVEGDLSETRKKLDDILMKYKMHDMPPIDDDYADILKKREPSLTLIQQVIKKNNDLIDLGIVHKMNDFISELEDLLDQV